MSSGALEVVVDGVKLPDEEARAMWARFSAWMDEHKGDLAGFAAREGFVSVKPAMSGGRPVLVASVREAQVAYANAREIGAPKGARGAGKPKR
ncbi:MAG: hypothetical protein IPK71_34395 [Myxococcales bacterium]|nr:hypothetical protein [Myxococcales bacterium]